MRFSSMNPPSHYHLIFRRASNNITNSFQVSPFNPPNILPTDGLHMYLFLCGHCTPLKFQTLQQNVQYFQVIKWDLNSLVMRRKWVTSQKFIETEMLGFPLFLDHDLFLSLHCNSGTSAPNIPFFRKNSEKSSLQHQRQHQILAGGFAKQWDHIVKNCSYITAFEIWIKL